MQTPNYKHLLIISSQLQSASVACVKIKVIYNLWTLKTERKIVPRMQII